MDQPDPVGVEISDEDLIHRAREGDRDAFAELWKRHANAGITVARRFTSSLDSEDLVAEAYARIYRRVLDGGGPDGAFRPYLYTTIRNLASRWGRDRDDIQIEDIEDLRDDSIPDDPSTVALDARMTATAFRSLPERWQAVLWYTEVEGMTPQEVAPILGLTANSVAALAYRAREGLRTAWLQAHVSEPGTTLDCKWVISRLGEHARRSLTEREALRFETHLASCEKCGSVALEVEEVGSSLAVVLLPLLLGVTAGGSLLASLLPGAAGAAHAASAMTIPDVPAVFETIGAAAAPAAAAAAAAGSASLSAPVLAGALAVTIALGGGVAVVLQPAADAATQPGPAASAEGNAGSADSTGSGAGRAEGDGTPSDSPGGVLPGILIDSDPVADLLGGLADPVGTIIPNLPIGPAPEHRAPEGVVGALLDLDLRGTGMPGATVSAQVAGKLYSTVVAANGTWAIRITALPEGTGPITLTQRLTILGVSLPIDIPLALLSDSLGVTVELLN